MSMKEASKFLPIFIFYFLFILVFGQNDFSLSDEGRYFDNAYDLLVNGYYTDPANPKIVSGPGYPFFLIPFLLFGLPPIVTKLFNAVFIFLSAYLFYELLKFYIPKRKALIFGYLLGMYYPLTRVAALSITECLTYFLMCAFLYTTMKFIGFEKFDWKKAVLPALVLGYLILTKIIFGYVVVVALVLFGGWYLVKKSKKSLAFSLVLAIGFLFSTPFLVHNYLLTGRYFYWGTNGGSQLYWMTSKKKNEYGSWFGRVAVLNDKVPGMAPSHKALYQSIDTLSQIEKNDRFLAEAKKNIKDNPMDYLSNLPPNVLRLFFAYPNSYVEHDYRKIYFHFFANMFILVPFFFSLIPAWIRREKIPFEIVAMMVFISIYFGGTILVYAYPRYLIPIIPFFLLWLAYLYSKVIKVSLR